MTLTAADWTPGSGSCRNSKKRIGDWNIWFIGWFIGSIEFWSGVADEGRDRRKRQMWVMRKMIHGGRGWVSGKEWLMWKMNKEVMCKYGTGWPYWIMQHIYLPLAFLWVWETQVWVHRGNWGRLCTWAVRPFCGCKASSRTSESKYRWRDHAPDLEKRNGRGGGIINPSKGGMASWGRRGDFRVWQKEERWNFFGY